jgi:tripartite-type tricarboxylate transporter receptor subunit TctC
MAGGFMPTHPTSRIIAALAAAIALGAPPAWAQSVADFYRGKTVTLLISSATGGGYDTLSRSIARYLPKHIPGNPGVIVRNMPGAGGITATNSLYNQQARDGTVIGGVQNNTPFEPLFGAKEAQYDATKFNWLGTPSIETGILTVWKTSPVDTLADVQKREITVGAVGVRSTPSFYARILNETLGTKLKIIVGYESQSRAFLAMERGEIDGYPSVFYSALMSTKPTWIKDGTVKLLVQFGLEKEPAIADVPFALDHAKNADDRQLMEAAFSALAAGRPYLMPPGVPADRIAAMRKALMDVFKDPDFLAEAEKIGLDVNTPRSGAQLQELIERIYQTPASLVERVRKLSNG